MAHVRIEATTGDLIALAAVVVIALAARRRRPATRQHIRVGGTNERQPIGYRADSRGHRTREVNL